MREEKGDLAVLYFFLIIVSEKFTLIILLASIHLIKMYLHLHCTHHCAGAGNIKNGPVEPSTCCLLDYAYTVLHRYG